MKKPTFITILLTLILAAALFGADAPMKLEPYSGITLTLSSASISAESVYSSLAVGDWFQLTGTDKAASPLGYTASFSSFNFRGANIIKTKREPVVTKTADGWEIRFVEPQKPAKLSVVALPPDIPTGYTIRTDGQKFAVASGPFVWPERYSSLAAAIGGIREFEAWKVARDKKRDEDLENFSIIVAEPSSKREVKDAKGQP